MLNSNQHIKELYSSNKLLTKNINELKEEVLDLKTLINQLINLEYLMWRSAIQR